MSQQEIVGGDPLDFYEFFAGGGMVRAALSGPNWRCRFANDFDHKKADVYRSNWETDGHRVLKVLDVRMLVPDDLPGRADLAWASFPCQDLSLAGGGAGLKGDRSGTFWPFWKLIETLNKDERAPSIVALENVCGTLTSHGGKDFAAICEALARSGYRFGAMVIDAALFLPQSRPRLFIVGVHSRVRLAAEFLSNAPSPVWHTKSLLAAYSAMPKSVQANWLWWMLPEPPLRNNSFADLVEENPASVEWHSTSETSNLLSMMSEVNLRKVADASKLGRKRVGTVYRRTRVDENGSKIQRAEVRFDDVAGCLRTPAGGSSRQIIIVVEGQKVRTRLISSRETARLMGLADSYSLPDRYNEAYHITGDGVAVPVVSYLSLHLFEPILHASKQKKRRAA